VEFMAYTQHLPATASTNAHGAMLTVPFSKVWFGELVSGRGCDRRVPQLLADQADVHALGTKFSRMGVPQPMGMHPLLDAGPPREPRQHDPDVLGADRLIRSHAKHGIAALHGQRTH
jgi:hypothetical protein